jgi:hypothetical protein
VAGNATSEYLRRTTSPKETAMRSLLLFFLGIPIPIIILIALFT